MVSMIRALRHVEAVVRAVPERSAAASGSQASKAYSGEVVPFQGANTLENKKKANPIDIHVGSRIRLRRTVLGMGQEKLAEGLGITFQQVQKYEKGSNRVGASRMQAISNILGVPVAFFFEDAPGSTSSAAMPRVEGVMDFLSTSEGLALNRAFVKIADPKVRRKVVELVKALAAETDSE